MPRPPRMPARDSVDPAELDDYDFIAQRYETRRPDETVIHSASTPLPYFQMYLAAPPLPAALSRLGIKVHDRLGSEGGYTPAEHEFIDIVHSFDFDYWGLLAYHTPYAIAEGVRLGAIEALLEGREEDLTDDERQQVSFIRAVAGGTMTDAEWDAMEQRLGSERGVVEYATHILLLQFHIRMHQTFGVAAIGRPEYEELLRELREGTRQLPAPEKGKRIEKRLSSQPAAGGSTATAS